MIFVPMKEKERFCICRHVLQIADINRDADFNRNANVDWCIIVEDWWHGVIRDVPGMQAYVLSTGKHEQYSDQATDTDDWRGFRCCSSEYMLITLARVCDWNHIKFGEPESMFIIDWYVLCEEEWMQIRYASIGVVLTDKFTSKHAMDKLSLEGTRHQFMCREMVSWPNRPNKEEHGLKDNRLLYNQ